MRFLPVRRALLAVAALATLLAGGVTLVASSSSQAVADDTYTIAILDTGFNPQLCIVNRASSHSVRWLNKGTEPHQVRSENTNTLGGPLFETTVLQPGETSRSFSFTGKSKFAYYDVLNPELKGTIEAGDGAETCIEATPTPTPTNTPTITPTPTRTPRPTVTPTPTKAPPPTPDPRKAILPMIAKDADP